MAVSWYFWNSLLHQHINYGRKFAKYALEQFMLPMLQHLCLLQISNHTEITRSKWLSLNRFSVLQHRLIPRYVACKFLTQEYYTEWTLGKVDWRVVNSSELPTVLACRGFTIHWSLLGAEQDTGIPDLYRNVRIFD